MGPGLTGQNGVPVTDSISELAPISVTNQLLSVEGQPAQDQK